MVTQIAKDPSAKLDYAVDWSSWLEAGETISDSEWTVEEGLTEEVSPAPSEADGITTIWLSGGTAGVYYTVTNTITTSVGRIDERSIIIRCVDR
jgi:TRAP-type uncharacterized transport system substrate-binding protein